MENTTSTRLTTYQKNKGNLTKFLIPVSPHRPLKKQIYTSNLLQEIHMKNQIILWTIICLPLSLWGQNCTLENPIPLLPNRETIHTISVGNYLNDDLADPNQGVCEVNIYFIHNWPNDVEMDLVSPAGDTVTLIGPDLNDPNSKVGDGL